MKPKVTIDIDPNLVTKNKEMSFEDRKQEEEVDK